MKKKSFHILVCFMVVGFVGSSVILTGCVDDGDVPIGTIAGGLGGAAVGSLIGGGSTTMATTLGGAALGGILGNQLVDKPAAKKRQEQKYQDQLDFERQSQIQHAQVAKQLKEQQLFDEWKKEKGYS